MSNLNTIRSLSAGLWSKHIGEQAKEATRFYREEKVRDFYKYPLPPHLTEEELDELEKGIPVPALSKQIGGDHYKTMAIQPIDYIISNNLGWCEGNAVKYITRHKLKGQRADIEKAIHYLQILLEKLDAVS
jgi:hypothetical protein